MEQAKWILDDKSEWMGRLQILKVAKFSAALALIVLSGCGPSDDSSRATISGKVGGPDAQMPGESVVDAASRIFDKCMDSYDEKYSLQTGVFNGVAKEVRSYGTSPESNLHFDACKTHIDNLGIIKAPSRGEVEASYEGVVMLLKCLRSKGHDMGIIVGREAYVAATGDIPLSDRWAQLNSMPAFQADQRACLTESPPQQPG
jgi:hypothetical protein